VFQWWARGTRRILGLRTDVRGVRPRQPGLLVANHLSYVDVILLAAELPTLFVAKQEVRGWPVWGPLARAVGTIFVDRTSRRDAIRVCATIESAVSKGETVVVFAEGTSTAGEAVRPLKPALLAPAARAALPVHHASISYQTPVDSPPAHLAVCWWGEMEFLPHLVELCGLREFTGIVTFGGDAIRGRDRKQLARDVHAAITRDFTPVVTRT
jgi:1-acyl-sn-glycerol-3-phosphate acyltransferase